MVSTSMMISVGLMVLVAAVLLVSSFKRAPGIGVIAALVLIAVGTWVSSAGLAWLGFSAPRSWGMTVVWALLLGLILQLLSTLVLEPLADRATRSTTDHSAFEGLRGNLKNYVLMLLMVWVVVVFAEEIIFRGYMMGEIARLIGTSNLALFINLALSSVLFGLAHWYQGRSGALSTGIIGAALGLLFILTGFNIWLPILTHGFIDTIGLFMIYINADKSLKERVRIPG